MKFTLSWLKKHLDTSANLEEILAALTDLGLEVENVEDPVESLHKVINQLRCMHAGIKNRLCYLQVVADAMNLTFEQACRDAARQQKKRNKRKRAQ